MRMWMVEPDKMCRQHLLGEHVEIHKFRHNFVKKHNMLKRIELNQIEPYSMEERHDRLVSEMLRRGYNHKSPYFQPDVTYLPNNKINVEKSYQDLLERCEECRKRK